MKPDLEAIRKRVEAATPGPWLYAHLDFPDPQFDHAIRSDGGAMQLTLAKGDAEFIAASRTDIPQLLAYIAKLEKVVEAARRHGEHGDFANLLDAISELDEGKA